MAQNATLSANAVRGMRLALRLIAAVVAVVLTTTPALAAMSTNLGSGGFGSIAVDDAGGHVFVSQPQSNVVDEFDFQGKLIGTIKNIDGAYGMAIDSAICT
jgi:DNA-binding beta-propeller fold protein YncE